MLITRGCLQAELADLRVNGEGSGHTHLGKASPPEHGSPALRIKTGARVGLRAVDGCIDQGIDIDSGYSDVHVVTAHKASQLHSGRSYTHCRACFATGAACVAVHRGPAAGGQWGTATPSGCRLQ